MRVDGTVHAVVVSDLSASGALVSLTAPIPSVASPEIVLLVDDFGPIPARIMHLGKEFWGVRFNSAHQHRDKLTKWLQEEVNA